MFSESFFSWIISKVSDNAESIYKNKKESKAIQKQLKDYMTCKKKEFDKNAGIDEIDFQGLEEYIMGKLSNEVSMFFRGTTDERNRAKNDIVTKAVSYASAKSVNSQKYVETIIVQCLESIRQELINQIETKALLNSNMAVEEINQIVNNNKQEIIEHMKLISKDKNTSADAVYMRRISILKSIENYDLPVCVCDIQPRKENPHNDDLSEAELSVIFNSTPGIVENYRLLNKMITEMDELIEDLLHFCNHYRESDGEGGFKNDVWKEILEYENIISLPNCTDDTIKEFNDYCDKTAFNEYISQVNEYLEYNYRQIQKRMNEIKNQFEEVKTSTIENIKQSIIDYD